MIRWKRGLAILLSSCMIFGITPIQAGAEETESQNTISGNTVETENTVQTENAGQTEAAVSVTDIATDMSVASDTFSGDASEADHYDENGFCRGYEIDPNGSGAWVKKAENACTDTDCNGYQPMTTVMEAGTTWYEISNAGQLYWFADQADNGKLLDANVRLTADIVDNEGATFGWDENNDYAVVATRDGKSVDAKTLRMWNPIGDAELKGKHFTGHFDGRGHLVSGLYYCKGKDSCSGLFAGAFKGTIIERIGIENSYIYGKLSTGGIVGYVEECTIQQCYNAAYVLSDKFVGGIAGGSDTDKVTFKQDFNVGYLKNFDSDTDNIGQIYEVDRYYALEMIDCYVMNDLNIPAIGNVSDLREGEVTFLSREDFYNGKAAYLLSWSTGLTWGQDLSSDNSLPNPCASDKYPVYKTCTGYTNDASKVHHSVVNGFCINDGCDYYEEPHFNATDDVYEIGNAGQLYAYADKAQRAYTKGARLMADIVVNEETLIQENGTPVTETANLKKWKGLFREQNQALVREVTFDGNNHSISGLYAKKSGLQGFVLSNYGTVKNLQIKNSVFISTDGTAGGIVGVAYDRRYTSKIENCSFEGYVEGAEYAGGIAGRNWNTNNCYANAYVKGKGTVNPIVVYNGSDGSITNTAYNTEKYTDGCTTSGVKGFTTDQFASGEVAYTLNQGSSDATTDTWKQTLDGEAKDVTPTLNTAKANVYRYERLRCDGATKTTDEDKYVYTNDASKSGKSIPDEHEYAIDSSDHTHHKCKVCNDVEAHNYTYKTVDGTTDTIRAVCDACGDSYTVKLTAPAGTDGKLTYTGYGLAASTGITEGVPGETLPDVEYATVTDGTESAYSADVPKNAGSYRAKLTLGSGENVASATVDYTIAKAVPLVNEVPTVAARVYDPGRMLTAADLTGGAVSGADGKTLAGAWSFMEKDIIPAVTNKGYQAVFTPEDTINYEAVTKTVTVPVSRATLYMAEKPAASGITYGQTLADSRLTGGMVTYKTEAGTEIRGSFSWKDGSIKPAASDSGSTEYAVIFTAADADNYDPVETKLTLTVSRAEKPFNAPEGEMCPAHSTAKVGDIRLPEGWCWLDSDREKELLDDVTVTATAVYTGEDRENYEKVSISIAITRSNCEHRNTTKGTKLKDATGAAYKVTSANGKTPAVQYLAPKSGAKGTVTVPAAVTIDGVTYKVTSIADNAFKGNKKIKKIVIGSNITSIGKNAFAGCTGLTSITIGKNVTKIGKNAFTGCKKLKSIIIKTKKLTTKNVKKGAFNGISKKVTIKVPKSRYKTYKKLLPAKGLKKTVKIRK